MQLSLFDYHLPEELIAQYPAEQRDKSRLMVLDRKRGTIRHDHFYHILDYLHPDDCLVLNDSRVLPARLQGRKAGTGGAAEFLLLKRLEKDRWETMVRPGKKLRPGDRVLFRAAEDGAQDVLEAEIVDYGPDGTRIVEFSCEGAFLEQLKAVGLMPLPPYIDRPAQQQDRERYQTVYSRIDGSIAAPTAGLHFTGKLLDEAKKKGVSIAFVTLHVGIGTFRPVKSEIIEEHTMHFEEYSISEPAARTINEARRRGGRIVCVGTTSVRTLESAARAVSRDPASAGDSAGRIRPGSGSTDIFIYPGYRFRMTDALITNFHLPRSTLLILISAFYDREKILAAYEEAVAEQYRFFSYGDAMLIK